MTEILKFNAESREKSGTGSSRELRRNGKIPGIVYGNNEKELQIALPLNQFNTEYQKGSFRTKLVELTLNGKNITVIPKEVQVHKVTDIPQHVDFIRVSKDTTVKIAVSVRIINEDKAPGIKRGGVVNIVHRNIDLLCHPSNIPHHIELDISGLEIGHSLHINDVKLPEGVVPADKSNFTVVSIAGRTAEDEKATEAATTEAAAAPAAKSAKAADKK
jgi:large subunit ribosomal protein L25